MKNNPKNQWEDHLTRRARAENYPARSVYKLEEIQNKFKVMKKNDRVLDLGCAPGSWLLYAAKQAGTGGRILGIDLSPVGIRLPENVTAVKENVLNLEKLSLVDEDTRFNVVLSDMAPATSGRKDVDAIKSYELCCMALAVAEKYLMPGGHFICKIFQGNDFKEFEKKAKLKFKDCKIFKPDSCRKQSKEIYIIAKFKN
ncbi:MAG: 50S rRNA methyltransferase [Desulfobacula sp. RIFOXYB2_FULL_45_6]|nr:MAG: 50S rRNA methyltransferase [Desulfobacula sp. RIFOXYB2_FULL_45_6]